MVSYFKPNQEYLFEILSISLELYSGVGANYFEQKGIVGNVWLDEQLLVDNQNLWENQKVLVGEYLQIYTEQGSIFEDLGAPSSGLVSLVQHVVTN